ncbi:MAG: diadenylate cyclase CdaA [Clostridia bacterium]|nr:diadenylate cyclase CdaA [Clostridia bacterium]
MNVLDTLKLSFQNEFSSSLENWFKTPYDKVALVIDVIIVLFLTFQVVKLLKTTRAWQLLKGVLILLIITILSGLLHFRILNTILSFVMSYGVILIIVILQPEIRRALEQLGTNKLKRFIGLSDDINLKTKENIYKIVIAAEELSKQRKGALIVIQREIKIQDIIDTGIPINGDISPQILVNIFEPKTPLHDGAVIITNNKIAAAACMLPLADDKDIARELGTRHRAAIGVSKESDALAVVVSEETGKISIAKDGTLIADVREDVLKKILIKNLTIDNQVKKVNTNTEN